LTDTSCTHSYHVSSPVFVVPVCSALRFRRVWKQCALTTRSYEPKRIAEARGTCSATRVSMTARSVRPHPRKSPSQPNFRCPSHHRGWPTHPHSGSHVQTPRPEDLFRPSRKFTWPSCRIGFLRSRRDKCERRPVPIFPKRKYTGRYRLLQRTLTCSQAAVRIVLRLHIGRIICPLRE
jgi:hypothetical protein